MSKEENKTQKSRYSAMIRKAGNSFVITVPPVVMKKLRLKKNQIVEVTIESE